MTIDAQALDDLYTELAQGMTEHDETRMPVVLARLVLLLMHEVGDAQRVRAAIREALQADQTSIGSSTKS